MKAFIAIVILIYSLFVFLMGDIIQKGMLLALLVLLGLIFLFYEYAYYAKTKISKYEELEKAVSIADDLTGFIKQLEDKKPLLEGKELAEGFSIGRIIGVLKRSKFKGEVIQTDDTPHPPSIEQQPPFAPQWPSNQPTSFQER